MKKSISYLRPFSVSRSLPVVVAALSLAGATAAQAVDRVLTRSTNATTNRTNINNALNNSLWANDRIVLPYHSSGWTVDGPLRMLTPGQELWIQGSGSSPGKINTSVGSFVGASDSLITIEDDNCTINGYSNGTSTANGRATLEMRRDEYVNNPTVYGTQSTGKPHESRMTVKVTDVLNATVKGLLMTQSGGDGVYIASYSTGAYPINTTVTDIIVDGPLRNGLSVITADTVNVSNSTFKNATDKILGCGIDIEPNHDYNRLIDINFTNCIMQDNWGPQVSVGMHATHGPNADPNGIDVAFYSCTLSGGSNEGIYISSLLPDGPGTGVTSTSNRVYFQNTTISNTQRQGIMVSSWAADKVRIVFNNVDLTSCGLVGSSVWPIYLINRTGDDVLPDVPYTMGDINFQNGCSVWDTRSHGAIIGTSNSASLATSEYKDITGDIAYHRTYTTTNPVTSWNGVLSNVNVTMTAY
jgi:hypothetical protein